VVATKPLSGRKDQRRRFLFESDSPIKLPAAVLDGDLNGYIASDPEPMLNPLDEPVFNTLTESSDDSAGEFLENPDFYILKKRGRRQRPRRSIRQFR
jgi:hypothetical protein